VAGRPVALAGDAVALVGGMVALGGSDLGPLERGPALGQFGLEGLLGGLGAGLGLQHPSVVQGQGGQSLPLGVLDDLLGQLQLPGGQFHAGVDQLASHGGELGRRLQLHGRSRPAAGGCGGPGCQPAGRPADRDTQDRGHVELAHNGVDSGPNGCGPKVRDGDRLVLAVGLQAGAFAEVVLDLLQQLHGGVGGGHPPGWAVLVDQGGGGPVDLQRRPGGFGDPQQPGPAGHQPGNASTVRPHGPTRRHPRPGDLLARSVSGLRPRASDWLAGWLVG
jgi:hypothetical protein